MASFKVVFSDNKPMRLKGRNVLAGLALTKNDKLDIGEYHGIVNGRSCLHVLNCGGKVFFDRNIYVGGLIEIPVTIDFDTSDIPDLYEIYTNDRTMSGLNVFQDSVYSDLPEDRWLYVKISDAGGKDFPGWAITSDGKINIQAAIESGWKLKAPFKVIEF